MVTACRCYSQHCDLRKRAVSRELPHLLHQLLTEARTLFINDCQEQFVLGGEVIMKQARRHVSQSRNLFHRRRFDPLRGEQLIPRCDQSLPVILPVSPAFFLFPNYLVVHTNMILQRIPLVKPDSRTSCRPFRASQANYRKRMFRISLHSQPRCTTLLKKSPHHLTWSGLILPKRL